MSIITQCQCGKRYSLDGSFVGRHVRCKTCGAAFVVTPMPQDAPPVASPPDFPPVSNSPMMPSPVAARSSGGSSSWKLWVFIPASLVVVAAIVIVAILLWPKGANSGSFDKMRVLKAALNGSEQTIIYFNIERAIANGLNAKDIAPPTKTAGFQIDDAAEILMVGNPSNPTSGVIVVRLKSLPAEMSRDKPDTPIAGFETFKPFADPGIYSKLAPLVFAYSQDKFKLEAFLNLYASNGGSISAKQTGQLATVTSGDFFAIISGGGMTPTMSFSGSFSGSEARISMSISAGSNAEANRLRDSMIQRSGAGLPFKVSDISVDGPNVNFKATMPAKELGKISR